MLNDKWESQTCAGWPALLGTRGRARLITYDSNGLRGRQAQRTICNSKHDS